MTLISALGYAFIGSIIGFVAGIIAALATPQTARAWHLYRTAKECRKITKTLLEKLARETKASN